MASQVENAIQIAASPSSDQGLKAQASAFLDAIRVDNSAWQVCLELFLRSPPAQDVVRLVALDIVNSSIHSQKLDQASLIFLRDRLLEYVRATYSAPTHEKAAHGQTDGLHDSAAIQNKLTQTATNLFTLLYKSGWESFFDDFWSLCATPAGDALGNVRGLVFYLRLIGSVHDEIADLLLLRSAEEAKRNNDLKDLIRLRDVGKVAASWQEILSRWQQLDPALVEMCLKTVSRWVSWIDISLVVNEAAISRLLEIAGQPNVTSADTSRSRARDAAINTFTEVVGKKMKPQEKIELIDSLRLADIVGRLIAGAPLTELRMTSSYDTDYAETVAKLVNNIVFDVVNVLGSDGVNEQTTAKADEILRLFVPYLLHFFTDQYDEVCCTVIPSLSDLLTYLRRQFKRNGMLPDLYASMISPVLESIVLKMKYDATSSAGLADDKSDEAEFQDLRKRLHVLQQIVAAINEPLYIATISRIVTSILDSLKPGNDNHSDWREVELALYAMYLFGELALKNGGLYHKSNPSGLASETLIKMMLEMFSCYPSIPNHPHPSVQLRFMEICVRYYAFFEHQSNLVPSVLDAFVTLAHNNHRQVRMQAWYHLLRLVKNLRSQIAPYAEQVVRSLLDILVVRVEQTPVNQTGDDDDDSDSSQIADINFHSQAYLFEAVGVIASSPSISVSVQTAVIRAVLDSLVPTYESALTSASQKNGEAVLLIHHIIMAWANLAKGSSDWSPGTGGSQPVDEMAELFSDPAERTIASLEIPQLNEEEEIRAAARFAFPRLLSVLGSRMLPQFSRWIEGLCSRNSTRDEISTFLRLLEQVIFGFKEEIFPILDRLLQPLLQRLLGAVSISAEGTDDEIFVAELRREYLSFILITLNNDLDKVFISEINLPALETIIQSIESFARDASDLPTARLAFSVLTRMTVVWGGPDLQADTNSVPSKPRQTLMDWQDTAITRFTPLSWQLITSPKFDVKNSQARQVLNEIAGMQLQIFRRSGSRYLESLRNQLGSLGVDQATIEEYLCALSEKDGKTFKMFFVQLFFRQSGA